MDDLQLFCLVVSAGSQLKAAERSGIPVSTLSRRLAALEQRLDVRLLERQGRELVATATGMQFYQRLSGELAQVQFQLTQLMENRHKVEGHLRLTVPSTLYQMRIASLLERFLADYPDVTVELSLSLEGATPETDRDLVIGFELGRSSELIARPFFQSEVGLFASPNYLREKGTPTSLDGLMTHDWIRQFDERQQAFTLDGETQLLSLSGRLVVNDLRAKIRAAQADLGLVLIPYQMLPDAGLVEVMPELQIPQRQAFVMYQQRVHQPKAMSLLIARLLD
ncbi:LysR family transcriptional regulator [Ferrimonas pelagia]|uniref:LysR family transcriptional regulator n=1 Tax=Ferrimonas pelagia TaxID=1177826 RepID=A0ABP9EBG3_9GAMM